MELVKWSKSRVAEHLWRINMLKGPKDYLNLHGSSFVIFFLSLLDQTSSKNFVLLVSEILRRSVNILVLDGKYSLSVKASV